MRHKYLKISRIYTQYSVNQNITLDNQKYLPKFTWGTLSNTSSLPQIVNNRDLIFIDKGTTQAWQRERGGECQLVILNLLPHRLLNAQQIQFVFIMWVLFPLSEFCNLSSLQLFCFHPTVLNTVVVLTVFVVFSSSNL